MPSVAHISLMTATFLQSSQRLAPTQHRNVLLVKVALNYLIKTQIANVNQNTWRTVSLQLIMTPAIKKLPSVFLFCFFSFSRMLQCLLIFLFCLLRDYITSVLSFHDLPAKCTQHHTAASTKPEHQLPV